MTAPAGDHLDETVFGPPSHEAVPHDHAHPAAQIPPGALHWHQHCHPGELLPDLAHNHRHGHTAPETGPETGP